MRFCHLHVHNEFSILDGYGSSKDYVQRAKELGQEFCGITNHGNIDGLIRFQREADKQGIKPVLGCELYLVPDASVKVPKEKRFHITVLIKNEEGFVNLSHVLTKANLHGFYYKPRTDFETLLVHGAGLVFMTGCGFSCIVDPRGIAFIRMLSERYTGDVYLEVMPHILPDQESVNRKCIDLSAQMELPLIATNDCHYVREDDSLVHEVLLAIQTKAKWTDKDRFRFETKDLFMRSAEQMKTAFGKQGILSKVQCLLAMSNTADVAEKCCGFKIKKHDIFLPSILMKNEPEDAFLKKLCCDGYERIFGVPEWSQTYIDRFNEEFDMIRRKNFVRYFLVVWELTEWCRKNNIMIGPGRGSVGGSLIAYLIGITTVDPIQFNLLFSRFIAEDRIDYPDIDLDFEDVKRPLIRGHLEEMYGKNNIASVSTFMDMKGRAAIRDVARVFDTPYFRVDEFAKSIEDDEQSDNTTIEKASMTPEGQQFKREYPDVVAAAMKLEGQVRGCGQHAAALVVSGEDLTLGTRCNLSVRSNQEVVNWDKDDAEYVGLMKLDILGLNTLSILNETRRLIEVNRGKKIVFEKIELDNQQVFEMLSKGETVGVFQFNTYSTTKLCKEIGINTFGLMSDVIALVRPGPADSGMTADFTKRKHGAKWKKKHRAYERITKDTFGIIVYQEQVMQVINQVAGLSYATADKIRKIIAKKRDIKAFEEYKQMFVDGCKKEDTLSEKEALEFWDALEKHSNYSFNRSHSIEYAMIAYWCAWCKLYFPAEFICANLSFGSDGKKEEIVKEARRLGLKVVLPKVGVSEAKSWVVKEGCLYIPFIEIKGIGDKTAFDCANYRVQSTQGFFNLGVAQKGGGKIEKILRSVGAIGDTPDEDLSKYFTFEVKQDKRDEFPVLCNTLGFASVPKDLDSILNLSLPPGGRIRMIRETTKFQNPDLLYCDACALRGQCRRPVMPSPGRYNIAIIGEAPGGDEDVEGKGFVGRAGDLVWKEFAKYDMVRRFFHVTNCAKCYPGSIKTPNESHLRACSKWLDEELKQAEIKLSLAFGNSSLKYFKGEDGGITKHNGKTEWSEKYGMWICWCIHPAAVLRNPEHKSEFQAGVKNFVEKIETLGGLI